MALKDKSEEYQRGYRAGRAAARRDISPHALSIDRTFKRAVKVHEWLQKRHAEINKCPKGGPSHDTLEHDGASCPKCPYVNWNSAY